jgi:ABC-type Na+ transport system ATPase subunit NatA
MTRIRKNLGICPQHNCLFDQLTVSEHLRFFAKVKGIYLDKTSVEAEEHIDKSMQDIALFEKRNTLSKFLSGGMKVSIVRLVFCYQWSLNSKAHELMLAKALRSNGILWSEYLCAA